MRKLILLFSFVFFVLLYACNRKVDTLDIVNPSSFGLVNGEVVVAVSNDLPPYTFKMGSDVIGYNVDIVKSIFSDFNIKVNFVSSGFSNLYKDLESGKINVIAVPISKAILTDDIKEKFFFSDPYYESYNVILYNTKVIGRVDENSDLSMYKTGIVEDSTFFIDALKSKDPPVFFSSYIDMIYRMKTRSIGYVILDKNNAESFSALDRFFAISELPDIKDKSKNAFVFVCSSKKLCEKLSQSLKLLNKENKINILKKEWSIN